MYFCIKPQPLRKFSVFEEEFRKKKLLYYYHCVKSGLIITQNTCA